MLANSAGTAFRSPAEDFPEEEFDRVVGLNLKGTYLPCQAFGHHMLARGSFQRRHAEDVRTVELGLPLFIGEWKDEQRVFPRSSPRIAVASCVAAAAVEAFAADTVVVTGAEDGTVGRSRGPAGEPLARVSR